jgi:hypothetical protein
MSGSSTQRGIGFFFGAPKYAHPTVFACDLCHVVPFSTQKALNAHVVAKHRDGAHLSDAELAAVRENVAVSFALAPERPRRNWNQEQGIVGDIELAEVLDDSELRENAHDEPAASLDVIITRPKKKKRRKGPRSVSSTRWSKSGSLSRPLMHWRKLSTRGALLKPLRVAMFLLLTFDAL